MLRNFFNFKPKRNNLMAIDIGNQTIKLLELKKLRNTYCIEKFEIQNITNNDLTFSLKKIISKIATTPQNAAFAISYSGVINKTIEINISVKPEEIENFLLLNMQKYIGLPADKIAMDYEIENAANTALQRIKMIITKKEQVNKFSTITTSTNLKAKIIDVNAFALLRAIKTLMPETNKYVITAANINGNSILLCTLDHGETIYIQEDFFEETNAKNFELITQNIINSIKASFSRINIPIKKILLFGELADDVNLTNSIAQQINIPLETTNIFTKMLLLNDIKSEYVAKHASEMVVCCGLALRKFEHAHC